jgi:hypothetical protein
MMLHNAPLTSQCYLCQLYIPKRGMYCCLPIQCLLFLPCGQVILHAPNTYKVTLQLAIAKVIRGCRLTSSPLVLLAATGPCCGFGCACALPLWWWQQCENTHVKGVL